MLGALLPRAWHSTRWAHLVWVSLVSSRPKLPPREAESDLHSPSQVPRHYSIAGSVGEICARTSHILPIFLDSFYTHRPSSISQIRQRRMAVANSMHLLRPPAQKHIRVSSYFGSKLRSTFWFCPLLVLTDTQGSGTLVSDFKAYLLQKQILSRGDEVRRACGRGF